MVPSAWALAMRREAKGLYAGLGAIVGDIVVRKFVGAGVGGTGVGLRVKM